MIFFKVPDFERVLCPLKSISIDPATLFFTIFYFWLINDLAGFDIPIAVITVVITFLCSQN